VAPIDRGARRWQVDTASGAVDASDGTHGEIPRRALGKHDVKVSIVGLGGHHLADAKDIKTAIRIVHEAIDSGGNSFDTCWEYFRGRSENWLGRARMGKRDKVFLTTKVCTHGRAKKVAMEQLDESLGRLNTDHPDLSMSRLDD
jgi:aryl-alcohol dehydrogenase-like predicted oxidoreductase